MSESIIHSEGALATEPARLIGAISTVVTAVFALAIVLGLDEKVAAAVMGLVASLLPIVVSSIIRQRVYSPASTAKLVAMGVTHGGMLMRRSVEGEHEG